MQFIDLKKQYQFLEADMNKRIFQVLVYRKKICIFLFQRNGCSGDTSYGFGTVKNRCCVCSVVYFFLFRRMCGISGSNTCICRL